HGANRLASNSLLEAVVYAARIAEDIADLSPASRKRASDMAHASVRTAAPDLAGEQALRRLMSSHVGVVRNRDGLTYALTEIARMERDWCHRPQLRNMATTALLITSAALKREESRGGHYRSDFPQSDPAQAKRTFLTLNDARAIAGFANSSKRAVA